MGKLTRRRLLAGTAAATVSIAGCASRAGRQNSSSDGPEVTASFFVLGEFAAAVAGDAVSVDTLVPFGQHGHGWEPSAGIQRDVLASRAFVYVGDGFQPWADRVVDNARDDGSDLTTIEGRREVDLLSVPGSGGDADHDDHTDRDDGDHDDHAEHDDHSDRDPYFWLDPARAATAVSTVEAGLSEVFPQHADVFAENAAAYRRELAELDETFTAQLGAAERDTALVAGHNAFQYLAARYGFEVHGLTGISPDDSPTPKDVRRAQDIIDREGVTNVLAPAFESDRAARQLVEETDARGELPITAIPGVTEDWHENGWGYLEVMREVNLASLATGLGA